MTHNTFPIKSLLLRYLPRNLLFHIKKWHYLRSLRSFSEIDGMIVKTLVNPGEHVIDIGANIGWYTHILAKVVGPQGLVHSIEPIPDTFRLLEFCTRKLGFQNIELHNLAISDRDGNVTMEIPQYGTGGDNLYQSRIISQIDNCDNLRRMHIGSRSLDSLFLCKKDISFIKCDVEGHELSVAKGAEKLTRKSKPAWLIEVSSDPDDKNTEAAKLFSHFEQLDYLIYWYDGTLLKKRHPGDHSTNYFLLYSKHITRLQKAGVSLQGT